MGFIINIGWVRNYLLPFIDVIIIAYVIYKVYLMISGTRAIQVVKGLALIIFAAWLARFLYLETVSWLLNQLIKVAGIALIILFQPELRRMLTRIGESNLMRVFFRGGFSIIGILLEAVEELSNKKIGSLIVLEGNVGLRNYIETGIRIDAFVSKELLFSIFSKNSPLHDGAVIIEQDRIVAAKCILPLTERHELLEGYGTRHLAALGMAEETDALVIVVSEETGKISVARYSVIETGISIKKLRERLEHFYHRGSEKRS
ncbi:MAG: TIGR00159 family protein [Spirochaetes bacterium]|nr:MAG: TIGR00159 family protein [Spirochaetota bacterium]